VRSSVTGAPAVRRSGLQLAEVVLVYASTVLVGSTGLLYAWCRYVATSSDPYALVATPWQPIVQHLHVLTAPTLVFAAGALWRAHVAASWQNHAPRRWSGGALVISMIPMIVSGYLVQVAVEEAWRQRWGVVHSVVSIAWLGAAGAHLVARRRAAR